MAERSVPNMHKVISGILQEVGVDAEIVYSVDLHIDYRESCYGQVKVGVYKKANGEFQLNSSGDDVITETITIDIISMPKDVVVPKR